MAKIVELFIGKMCIAHENFSLTFKFSFTEIAAGKSKLIEFASVKDTRNTSVLLFFLFKHFLRFILKSSSISVRFQKLIIAVMFSYYFLLFGTNDRTSFDAQ